MSIPDPIAIQIGSLQIRWYGILIGCGVIAAFITSYLRCRNRNLDIDRMLNIFLLAVPFGIVGARLYYVIFNWGYYSAHPDQILAIWHGGLAIHGGIIGGIIAIAIYLYIKKDNMLTWLDIVAPGVILAQGIGRWGNFFNQEAYGRVTDLPWAMYIDGAYRHPTFLYESIWDVCGFIVLLALGKSKKLKTGDITAAYFIFYSLGRFFIESLRTDSLMLGNLRMAMLISLIGVLLGCVMLVFNHRKKA